MAKPDLDAIWRRCETAAPGPWHLINGNQIHDRETKFNDYGVRIGDTPNLIAVEKYPNGSANVKFIAHARTDIPVLLDYIKELHQQIHTLEKSLDSNFKEELVAKSRLQAVNFAIDNNGCEGELTNDDWCKFCFMRQYCEERKA